jgi:DNA invertase Pin-like site-specific DNA recombinase
MGTGKRIGYKRVSTTDQNAARQLENVQIDKEFVDYASAKSTKRPQLQNLLEFVREDDIVIVHSMDRLARNLRDLKELVEGLVKRGIQVHFIKESMQFNGENNASSMLVLHLMGAFAEFEYSFIKERQREGIAIAKRLGKYKGTKKKLNADHIELLKDEMQTRKSKAKIAKQFGISRFTLYRYLEEIEKGKVTA